MNIKLTLRDNRVFIDDSIPRETLWDIDTLLSYYVQGHEFSPQFKARRWDGKKKLLESSNLSAPLGLANKIKTFLVERGYEVQIEDQRPPKKIGKKINILPALAAQNKIPFDYQLEAVDVCKQIGNDRGIIRAATGSGKTVLSALIAAEFGVNTVVYVIGKDLLYQFYELYKSLFGEDNVGLIGDGQAIIKAPNKTHPTIHIASIWTVGVAFGLDGKSIISDKEDMTEEKKMSIEKYDLIRRIAEGAKLVIIDECHMSTASTFTTLFTHTQPERIYGLSATDWKDSGDDIVLEANLGNRIVNIPASLLIELGYLVPPIIKFINVGKSKVKLPKNYQTIYSKHIIENDSRNDLIIQGAVKLVEQGYKPLVLFSKLKHGQAIYDKLSKEMECVLLSGKDSSEIRLQANEDFLNGKIKAIVVSNIYDIGVDLPCVSAIICSAPSKSTTRVLQRVGRAIRKDYNNPNKTRAIILEFFDDVDFLKAQARIRKRVYEAEGFKVYWPKGVR